MCPLVRSLAEVWLERCASSTTRIRTADLGSHQAERYVHMIIIGIDLHKTSHTAVAVDERETVLSERTTRACRTQTQRLRSWAEKFDERVWAVESANGLVYLLRRNSSPRANELSTCHPLCRPARECSDRSGPRRTIRTTPARLRSPRTDCLPTPQQVRPDDHAKVLKLTAKRHRDLARLRNQAACRVHALWMELVPGAMANEYALASVNVILDCVEAVDHADRPERRVGA